MVSDFCCLVKRGEEYFANKELTKKTHPSQRYSKFPQKPARTVDKKPLSFSNTSTKEATLETYF